MKNKFKKLIVALLSITILLGISVSAKGLNVPYNSYEYNSFEESVAAPAGYILTDEINSKTLGLEIEISEPQDIFVSKDGDIYILDSGNSRIIVLNKDFALSGIIEKLKDESGEEFDFSGAKGFTVVNKDAIYIADTDNQRVLNVNSQGIVKQVIKKPKTSMLEADIACNFTKVITDKQGRLYAIADDVNIGAMVYSAEGKFITFFGGNKVDVTLETIRKYLTRRFMSETQLKASFQYKPVNISNFDIDTAGFIFTVTKEEAAREATAGRVRRLNAFGSDTLSGSDELVFGDLEWDERWDKNTGTTLSDIDIDSDGLLYMLDSSKGRIFCYSEDAILLTEFGGHGTQKGLFNDPSSIETANGFVYVLDSGDGSVKIFSPTEYFNLYRTGILNLNEGYYDKAEEAFNQVLTYNSNSEMAYFGIGKALDAKGEYATAMEYFRKSNSNEEYSNSFVQYRKLYIRENFLPIVGIAILVIALIIFGFVRFNRLKVVKEGETYCGLETKSLFPFYTMSHPADGFAQFRNRGIMSYAVTAVILVVWFLISVVEYFWTGFCFNENRPSDYRIIYTLLQTVALFALFVIANYAICTLLEGKGKFKELTCGVAYSLLPMLIFRVIALVMSNVMVQNEGTFITVVTAVGILWTAIILFIAISTIHQYSFGKTVACILLTVFGMLVILLLIVLFYSLLSQLGDFITSVFTEVSLR